ncbi:MAG: phosphoribosyl-AMP cyclohydrolase [Pseudobacteriovorax sp.]|nr:phosphoribosyl-AMP cyclohydrolase [Pseudobacteriovorax sp.]
MINDVEEGLDLKLDFQKLNSVQAVGGLIPVAVQDIDSGEVLMIAYTNQLALDKTIETGRGVFWSSSRNELWYKGKTSGDILEVEEIRVNCEQNSLLYRVRLPTGSMCHTSDTDGNQRYACYYRRVHDDKKLSFVKSSPYSGK